MIYRAVLFVSILLLATLAVAQRGPITNGTNMNGPTFGRNASSPDLNNTRMSGSIYGNVTSLDDRPVANAQVELHNVDTGLIVTSVYSNDGGAFVIENVPPGQYDLVVRDGLSEGQERVTTAGMRMYVTVRMSNSQASETGNSATVSVAQMNVPDKARKAYQKAQEEFSKGKLAEADGQLDKALKIYPNYAEALTLRGVLDLQQQRSTDAVAELEKAVDCDHNYAMAHIALGSAYNSLKRFDDAVRVLDRGISLAPNAWQGYFERARALIAKNQYPESLRDLAKAQSFAASDLPILHLVKADALLGMGDYQDGQAELQTYLDRDPQGSNAAEARRVLDQVKAFTATAQKK